MQELNIAEVGLVKIRKLSNLDYAEIRNRCIRIDNSGKEETNTGNFIKYMVIYGISESPFFKSKFPEKTRMNATDYTNRENEYNFGDTPQKVMDTIFKHIRDYNNINDSEIKEVVKEQSSI